MRFRLAYLAEVVDVFVLVEAPWTHTGHLKPLRAANLLAEIGIDRGRVRHIVVEEILAEGASASRRERVQHRSIRRGLEGVDPDDLVIVGDIDELPWPETVACLRETLKHPARLVMEHAVLAANLKLPTLWTDGPKACRGNQLDHEEMALLLGDEEAVWSATNPFIVPNAGWHLSYLGGAGAVREKLASFQHTEFDTPFNRSAQHLRRCVHYGVDLRGHHLLKRLEARELPAMLVELQRTWPGVFDFRPDPPHLARLLYRAYARARQWERFPASLGAAADRRSRLRLALACAVVPADLMASLALRVRDWRRLRGASVLSECDHPRV